MATILVGPQEQKFVVHQALLCDKSRYFAKALAEYFEESKTGIVKLEDISPTLFKIVVSWLYCGKIIYTVSDDGSSIDRDFAKFKPEIETSSEAMNTDDTSTWPIQVLVELYVLADRLDIKELRTNTIDALDDAIDQSRLDIRSYTFIDSNTTATSPLRKYAVDTLAYDERHNILDLEFWLQLPPDIAVTALLVWGQRVPLTLCGSCYQQGLFFNGVQLPADHPCKDKDVVPREWTMCNYHEHTDGEEQKVCEASRDETLDK